MKKAFLILILCFGVLSYGQNKKAVTSSNVIVPSISNLQLGLDENYVIEKYGLALLDTLKNSTRTLRYAEIKLDNNFILTNVTFSFFKKKLFRIAFDFDDKIHRGLTAKYGYNEIEYNFGYYGSFKQNMLFIRSGNEDLELIFMLNEKISDLSESEGF